MDNLINLNDYLVKTLDSDTDINLNNLLNEDYYEEIFSSEFFDNNLNENKKYDEDVVFSEYRKIRKEIRKGNQKKSLKNKFFEYHKEFVKKLLVNDKHIIKETINVVVENLNKLNETSSDYTKNEIRKNKINLIEKYKRQQIRNINKQLRELDVFYKKNPKILAV